MIVIADTGPINYLIAIGHIEVLPILYSSIVIPAAVRDELMNPGAPDAVRRWIETPPAWLSVRETTRHPDVELFAADLDAGEIEAILLAEEIRAELIILDDQLGRREADRRMLRTIGTLGVLRDAAKAGLINLKEALGRLRATNFHVAQELIDRLLAEAGPT